MSITISPEVAKEYKIDMVPTFIVFKEGKEKGRVVTFDQVELNKFITQMLG